MRAVMISIRPEWCRKIMSGDKTVEVRKTRPKLATPFKCYIYCTEGAGKHTLNIPVTTERLVEHLCDTGSMISLNCPIGNGKVIGEFICDKITWIDPGDFVVREDALRALQGSCLSIKEAEDYAGWKKGMPLSERKGLYGWHISDLKIYDKPIALNDPDSPWFLVEGDDYTKVKRLHRPPQSWCYVEGKTLPGGGADHE